MSIKIQEPLADVVRDLLRALRTLSPDQGRVARRNARRRTIKAAQRLLDEVAEAYPTERRVPTRRRLKATNIHEGCRTTTPYIAGLIMGAGIRVQTRGRGKNKTLVVPIWAVTIAVSRPEKLRAAKKDIIVRKALLAEIALKNGTY